MTTREFAIGAVAGQFPLGEVSGLQPYGSGHINDTFAVNAQKGGAPCRYILQRINTKVFTNPERLMQNILGVTEYLKARIRERGGDPDRETLTVIRTNDGAPLFRDGDGGCWRCYLFVEDTVSYDLVQRPEDFYCSAVSFGFFQRQLADYPAQTLFESIPDFHNTPNRLRLFKEALAADPLGRAKAAGPEADFVLAHGEDTRFLYDLQKSGALPLRVTHNDTKLNNILIDKATGKGICVIDLDTVMPGLVHYDYGDSIRFGASTALEDETDLCKVEMDLNLFDVYTKGFLEEAGEALTAREKETLPMGAKLMTLECGIRFLTDHLLGDSYFKIHRPGHNLDRCRTQFKLVADMEAKWGEMAAIVKKYS